MDYVTDLGDQQAAQSQYTMYTERPRKQQWHDMNNDQ